ncbi:sigma-70 family RNA polymerase sigma factor [Spongiactinospora sp. TRM90649]|uniref:RNA polymerase sigma factor n=1 Tax=Spongiactinospora sp. TRM90649 TaxID=3031114 RepID=UPI0023F67007|nr:sigma-70 family RNA polymerase sigma factor [Spongiactinospora sp. TRM90649]MDF5756970.1 sigma-70 family RNA polymerase sigma factor [Spongiactinospora sp. TRM90649]
MPADPAVSALVKRASTGDQGAWNDLVERYAPMVWSICRQYRLDRRDVDDVAQQVWMAAVEHLGELHDPGKMGSWLATTTKRECSRVLRAGRQHETVEDPLDFEMTADDRSILIEDEVEAAERNAVLRTAFTALSPPCRRMLSLLLEEMPYNEISARLGIPIGSVGPTRARCLAKLRSHPALVALMESETEPSGGERHV